MQPPFSSSYPSFLTQYSQDKSPEPKPFDFLQHLEGSQKGQTIKGVNQLKQYLRRFGYLSTSATLLDGNDEFDEILESAIKTYQLNYNLKATGTLDSQTIKQMMMPRCGVPDIHENGRTSMSTSGKSNKKHRHDQKLLHTVSHYELIKNPRWPPSKTQFTYAFNSSSSPVVDIQTLRSVCSKAFSKWAAVTGLSFVEVAADQADLMIGIFSADHGDGASFNGPDGVLAHALPRDGRFEYNADQSWSINPMGEMSKFDLESVAVHEIGHLLGLDHSLVPTAVMYSGIRAGVIKRELDGDDIEGIRAVYGLPN